MTTITLLSTHEYAINEFDALVSFYGKLENMFDEALQQKDIEKLREIYLQIIQAFNDLSLAYHFLFVAIANFDSMVHQESHEIYGHMIENHLGITRSYFPYNPLFNFNK